MVDAIGIMLGLQTEAIAAVVVDTAFALAEFHKVAGIELDTGLGGGDSHGDAGVGCSDHCGNVF